MKNLIVLIVMTLLFSSCSLASENRNAEIVTPEVETKIEADSAENPDMIPVKDMEEVIEEEEKIIDEIDSSTPAIDIETQTEATIEEDTQTEISIIEELANGTEDEQILNEVVNEITEIFELVEQNGE